MRRHRIRYLCALLLGPLLLAVAPSARAIFARPDLVPIDRLIANTEAWCKEHPEDPQGYYTLARTHYLAFVNRAAVVSAFEHLDPPRVAPDWKQGNWLRTARSQEATRRTLAAKNYKSTAEVPVDQRDEFWRAVSAIAEELTKANWRPPALSQEELIAHAKAAAASFEQALKLAPDNALFVLGQASLWRQVAEWTAAAGVPLPLEGVTPDRTADEFYRAYELAIHSDLRIGYRPVAGLTELVSYEAGNTYLKLTEGKLDLKDVKARRTAIAKRIARLERLPFGAVTPLVFAISKQPARLADLLDPARRVRFDINGDGAAERCPWLRPTTGLLVWDPAHTGHITSGRQLFGSVTWWLFFPDGYRVLDALDDNRDGTLTSGELAGIRCWFDRNSDGQSDPGEVVDLVDCGITGLDVRADGTEDGCLRSAKGLHLADGRRLPTWDWLVTPKPISVEVAQTSLR